MANKPKILKNKAVKKTIVTLLITIISLVALLPYYTMVSMSTHNTEGIFTKNVLIPGSYVLDNLTKVFKSGMFRFYFNSIKISTISTFFSLLISSTGGYALAKLDFKGRNSIKKSVFLLMLIPAYLSLLGYVKEMGFLGLTGTHLPLIIIWFANPFGLYWMSSYIADNVPNEVLLSARIDGCNEYRAFFNIVIPYISPALITMALLVFLWSWNLYLLPLILINKVELYTIPLGMSLLDSGMNATDFAARITMLTVSTLPLIFIFAFGTKYFVSGLTAGSIKG